jgi:hypothetical protein
MVVSAVRQQAGCLPYKNSILFDPHSLGTEFLRMGMRWLEIPEIVIEHSFQSRLIGPLIREVYLGIFLANGSQRLFLDWWFKTQRSPIIMEMDSFPGATLIIQANLPGIVMLKSYEAIYENGQVK